MAQHTLVLTPWYFPRAVIRWQDAITLLCLDKVEVVVAYSEQVRSPSISMPLPAVVRLRRQPRPHVRAVKFSRRNVHLRDGFACTYCGARSPAVRMTIDHVMPRSRGGRTEWENVVTACGPCNARKANMTPEEAGMFPNVAPHQPKSLPLLGPRIDVRSAPAEWADFVSMMAG